MIDIRAVALIAAKVRAGLLQQAFGINPRERIAAHVGVRVWTRLQRNRIGLDVSADARIVIAFVVVVRRGLAVDVLAREPEVVGKRSGCRRRRRSSVKQLWHATSCRER